MNATLASSAACQLAKMREPLDYGAGLPDLRRGVGRRGPLVSACGPTTARRRLCASSCAPREARSPIFDVRIKDVVQTSRSVGPSR